MWTMLLIVLALIYALNPYDILPDMMIGWGWLDDLIIVGLLFRYFHVRKKKRQASQKYYQHSQRAYGDERETAGGTGAHANSNRDPYRVLGIERGASRDEIKSAYRRLAIKYHPDKVAYLGDEFKVLAEKRFREIQAAYQELMPK